MSAISYWWWCCLVSDWNAEKKQKKRSRWGNEETDKTIIPGMPTVIPANLSGDQEKQYLGKLLSTFLCPPLFSFFFFFCSALIYKQTFLFLEVIDFKQISSSNIFPIMVSPLSFELFCQSFFFFFFSLFVVYLYFRMWVSR